VLQDQMQTAAGARSEIQLDTANILRLGQSTEIHIADLENHRYTVQVGRGTATYRIMRDGAGDVEIGTPIVSVRPLRRGSYRIFVNDDGSAEITVRSGEADIMSQRGSQRLRAGQTMLSRGTQADPEFQIVAARGADEFDRWSDSRDTVLANSRSAQYVSPDITGTEDLDAGGRWVTTPEYGNVWTPTVAPGWAPYRYGRWVWEDYYGWTWVSYDPWGWAPYHYGRWFNSPSFGWCWWPGGYRERHFWRPALVGFVGFGGGFGIGWVPLAPFEVFHPWYGRGFYGGYRSGFYNTGGIVANVNVGNVYRNARVNNGVTNVRTADFGRGSVNHVGVDSTAMRSANLMRGGLPVSPDRGSLRYSDRNVQHSAASSRSNSSFYSRRTPTTSDRVPFEQQRSAISRATGSSSPAAASRGNGNVGGQSGATRSSDAAAGWRRFGDPTSRPAASTRPSTGTSSSNSGGWDRFGNSGSSRSSGPVAPRSTYSAPQRNSAPAGGTYSAPQRNSAPPPVRQSAPSYNGGGRSSNGGGRSSAPAPSSGGRSSSSSGGGHASSSSHSGGRR